LVAVAVLAPQIQNQVMGQAHRLMGQTQQVAAVAVTLTMVSRDTPAAPAAVAVDIQVAAQELRGKATTGQAVNLVKLVFLAVAAVVKAPLVLPVLLPQVEVVMAALVEMMVLVLPVLEAAAVVVLAAAVVLAVLAAAVMVAQMLPVLPGRLVTVEEPVVVPKAVLAVAVLLLFATQ
jgi:hypothetical protein